MLIIQLEYSVNDVDTISLTNDVNNTYYKKSNENCSIKDKLTVKFNDPTKPFALAVTKNHSFCKYIDKLIIGKEMHLYHCGLTDSVTLSNKVIETDSSTPILDHRIIFVDDYDELFKLF